MMKIHIEEITREALIVITICFPNLSLRVVEARVEPEKEIQGLWSMRRQPTWQK